MDSERESITKPSQRSVFDEPIDLFHFNQIQPLKSPSPSHANVLSLSHDSRKSSFDDIHKLEYLFTTKSSVKDRRTSSFTMPFSNTPHRTPNAVNTFINTNLSSISTDSEVSNFPASSSQATESCAHTSTVDRMFPLCSGITPDNSHAWLFSRDQLASTALYHDGQSIPSDDQDLNDVRPYSHEWYHDTQNTPTLNSRLLVSHSDPRNVTASISSVHSSQDNTHEDVNVMICPQYQHYGLCSRIETCPFVHNTRSSLSSKTPFIMPSTTPYPVLTNTGHSLYQQYSMFSSSATSFFLPPSPPMSHHQHHNKHNNSQHQRIIKSNVQHHHNDINQLHIPRKSAVDADANRFNNAKVDDFVGMLYELCKDQNGCRFLQKKIEEKENNGHNIQLIFQEVHPHFIELMTDPFGNYLCQKMLTKCNDYQRTIIVKTVAPDLVALALNMHGTRAVQKLIEFLSTSEQIQIVTDALNSNVVTLIKDLNGNHVIQKCLNRLSAEDNQFIYNAVCDYCVEVASHKHGCCVLQRCFDHATIPQKNQLVEEIARHALTLVQNPFGNYVVQYVLELRISEYSESVILRFVDHVCLLSAQKFSSNVIEKCIRTAMPNTRRLLIKELMNESVMEKLLHDSFANYVVQTSLDCADDDQRAELVECIRPLLPTLRTTPYGKRIHSKIFRDQKSTQSDSTPQHIQRQKY